MVTATFKLRERRLIYKKRRLKPATTNYKKEKITFDITN